MGDIVQDKKVVKMIILIISPNPGDEIFGCGGIIYIKKFTIIEEVNERKNLFL